MNLSCCQCKGWSWFLLLSECFSCFLCLPDEIFESRVKLFSCAGLGFALSCSFLLDWNNFSAWGIHQLLLLCIFINTHCEFWHWRSFPGQQTPPITIKPPSPRPTPEINPKCVKLEGFMQRVRGCCSEVVKSVLVTITRSLSESEARYLEQEKWRLDL